MLYELRSYTYAPGQSEALQNRMSPHTTALFSKHGIEVVGFWENPDASKLIYLVRFEDAAQREAAWKGFQADPVWKELKASSEAGGSLASAMDSVLLSPTPYSPMQ